MKGVSYPPNHLQSVARAPGGSAALHTSDGVVLPPRPRAGFKLNGRQVSIRQVRSELWITAGTKIGAW